MPIGGSKPGERRGGQQAGTPNRRTVEREQAIQAVAEQVATMVEGAFEGDAHALLMFIYKDPNQPMDLRLDAAKAAVCGTAWNRGSDALSLTFGGDLGGVHDRSIAMMSWFSAASLVPPGLVVDSVAQGEDMIVVTARGKADAAACPACGILSRAVSKATTSADHRIYRAVAAVSGCSSS